MCYKNHPNSACSSTNPQQTRNVPQAQPGRKAFLKFMHLFKQMLQENIASTSQALQSVIIEVQFRHLAPVGPVCHGQGVCGRSCGSCEGHEGIMRDS